ncbi:enoyl-CoA hydratase-related protein [Oceanobacillus sp. J11TS1]|uniref:enoyl-CoA hydratase-related protein n=1 Tax=Oceanobacillus sp. J11TS1 TaxID=2807191 RepID=UPI001B07DEDF|nr:enoyl-CoA hydratase-related protein [Oceanobacillus sp. J11TS1]GIO23627.1 2-(1,2-epoxy-1,2-dihydrophenyl)acetyl-CoA isomerase [Oceanobacillus sp. J11TS1]
MYETINYEIKEQVGWIILNRPDKLNAFTSQMNQEMIKALKTFQRDADVRAIVITGEGKAFCSGEDLSGLRADADHRHMIITRYKPMMETLAKTEKPTIAAINGAAAGAGFSLALGCDFRIVSEKASFIQAFINIGLIPDSGSLYYLPRIVGMAKALELTILGEKIKAHEAKDYGLVTKVVSPDNLNVETQEFAERLANLPTKAIGLIKRYMQQSFETSLEQMLDLEAYGQKTAGLTEDYKEGVQAFFDKRKPEYKGY